MPEKKELNISELRFEWLAVYIKIGVAFLITGCLIRVYEYVLVTGNFVLPENAPALYGAGFLHDLLFFSFWAVLFSFFYICVQFLHKKTAFWATTILAGSFLMICVLVIQYFAEVLTPLGSDFFAYNFTELSDTVNTSVDITAGRIAPVFFFPALFGGVLYLLCKKRWNETLTAGAGGALVVLGFGYLFLYPAEDQYIREIDYALTANKAGIFINDSLAMLLNPGAHYAYEGPEFPLLRESYHEDVLAPYFETGPRPPNLVFILVESLGGTVIPPHDSYGGFTPFLDSLAAKSLYWTHFMSTSGRSFNVQPSVFGSLPFGNRGFMELGYLAPEHHTLISILNENGYHSGYYSGYDTRFDKLDQFLERQQIDLLIDMAHFTDDYVKMDEIEGGFTWGYSDKDTYRRAFDFIGEMDSDTPRLDIFFTLNFHEPFIIQDPEYYHQKFRERLDELNPASDKRAEFEQYINIFSALLYTDDAIRELMARYRQREDYGHTIFIITGDHRMIPVPHRNRIDRYYVPFLIYSPLLKQGEVFAGVSSHLDITPTLLAHLETNYQISIPDSVHWLGGGLNMSTEFSAGRTIPLMRNKNQVSDYLAGNLFLSGNRLFELEEGMQLRPLDNPEKLFEVKREFERFLSLNRYVTAENKLIRVSDEQFAERRRLIEEAEYFNSSTLRGLTNEELFFKARELAFAGEYGETRLILTRVLRESPNNQDARLLLGRTYGWDGDYETAESHFREVIKRNPGLPEAYEAIGDLYFWQGDPEATLRIVNLGLARNENHVPLLFRKARAHRQAGREARALEYAIEGLKFDPGHEELKALYEQLN